MIQRYYIDVINNFQKIDFKLQKNDAKGAFKPFKGHYAKNIKLIYYMNIYTGTLRCVMVKYNIIHLHFNIL